MPFQRIVLVLSLFFFTSQRGNVHKVISVPDSALLSTGVTSTPDRSVHNVGHSVVNLG